MCFVDYKKAFDMVKHNDLKVMLNSIKVTRKKCKINKEHILEARSHSKGIDWENVYKERGQTGLCNVARLFQIVWEIIPWEVQSIGGVKIGGKNLDNIRYADDIILMPETEQGLQQLLNAKNEASSRKGLKPVTANTSIELSVFESTWLFIYIYTLTYLFSLTVNKDIWLVDATLKPSPNIIDVVLIRILPCWFFIIEKNTRIRTFYVLASV